MLVLGHADKVDNNTLSDAKNKYPFMKISQWFLDPLSKKGPDYEKNRLRVTEKSKICDASFITTSPDALDFKLKNSFFIPNPCDLSLDNLKNYNRDKIFDIFFAISHGVHRGLLRPGKTDEREIFISKLKKLCDDVSFDTYGMFGKQPIWGNEFIKKLSNARMALNLSRGKPIKYYSSDRIAQLMGNGLLTFIHEDTKYNDFFKNDEMIFYKNISDLSEKIKKYSKDKKECSFFEDTWSFLGEGFLKGSPNTADTTLLVETSPLHYNSRFFLRRKLRSNDLKSSLNAREIENHLWNTH